MRSLLVALRSPWPPRQGVDLRVWQHVDALASLGEVGLFALGGAAAPPPNPCVAHWAVGARRGDPADPADDLAWARRDGGLPSDGFFDPAAAERLHRLVDAWRPDVVVLEELWLHAYVDGLRARAPRLVLSHHNVETDLHRQLAAADPHAARRLLRRRFVERLAVREREVLAAVDQVWVCSEDDRRRVLAAFDVATPIHVVPNAVDVARYAGADVPRPAALDGPGPALLFPATFGYPPNQAAAAFLAGPFLEALGDRLPDVRVVLAGREPTAAMRDAAARDPRIVVTDLVDDMVPYLRHAAALVVPLFAGSGTRFKILEAFAAGLPVVSTPKGAEGLVVVDGEHLLTATDAATFADAVVRLDRDPARAAALAAAARARVDGGYSYAVVRRALAAALGVDG